MSRLSIILAALALLAETVEALVRARLASSGRRRGSMPDWPRQECGPWRQ